MRTRGNSVHKLSIAIFGNINNYSLLLAQGLRTLGHNVRLVLNRKDLLHRPESRYPDWADNYPNWVVDCSNLTDEDIEFETPAINQVIHQLTHNVDFVILNDTGPALAGYLRAPYAVVLTGSDLAYYASFDSIEMRTSMWDPEFKRSLQGRRHLRRIVDSVARQRDGILGAEVVCYGQRGLVPSGDQMLDGIGVIDERRLMLHFSNTIDLQVQPAAKNNKLTILCGSRIIYRPEHNPALSAIDFKGIDILLKGFALYCQRGGNGELRLPRKGQDLQAAVELISELAIVERIHWLDEMPLAQFYKEMIAVDLVCDQFGSSFPGMVTTDAYALGRPVMAKFRAEIFGQRFLEPFPGFNAESPEQIADHLMLMEKNKAILADMGLKSRAYAEVNLSPESMAKQLLEKLPAGVINV